MPDLNLDLNYFDHPKTKRLIGLLGKGAEVLPVKLWCACGRLHAENGVLADYSPQEIESTVEWWGKPGECEAALLKVGFIAKCDRGYEVCGWHDHQGHIAAFKTRAKDAAITRWERVHDATAMLQASAKQCSNGTKPTKPKKKKKELVFFPLPEALDKPPLSETWVEYQYHRDEKGAPLTERAANMLFKKIVPWGVSDADLALRDAIANGWTGVYRPKGGMFKQAPPQVNGASQAYKPSKEEQERRQHYLAVGRYLDGLDVTAQLIHLNDYKRANSIPPDRDVQTTNARFRAWLYEQIQKGRAA